MPPLRMARASQQEYEEQIAKGLGTAYDRARQEERELSKLRIVVFSDLHRGARDGADDFERCEPAYSAALGHYLEEGFELFLLGDVEELWENSIDEVLPKYRGVAELERAFMQGPGLRRFYGNHDLDWSSERKVRDHLQKTFSNLTVHEALRLTVNEGGRPIGELFFVHGHQGTDFSDRGWEISRLALRLVWRRVQRAQGLLSTTPAESYSLRHKHDAAMSQWAESRARGANAAEARPVLIAGHTHHPVFPDNPVPRETPEQEAARASASVDEARAAGAGRDELARLRAEAERLHAITRREPYDVPLVQLPCYFNVGCCCFPDREVTLLKFDGDEVQLVRWLDTEGRAFPKELISKPASLRDVFARMAAA
jgi:UDP-2,3-diacylglucosamine pyrophosphatase LpxH